MSADMTLGEPGADEAAARGRISIFRAADACDMAKEMGAFENMTPVDEAGMQAVRAAGGSGSVAKIVYADKASGLSLSYVWFKANYVLPRHSHDADCLYYITAGEAHLGSEVLTTGDGFFVPAGANYHYTAGPDGVEVLEFRTAATFNFRFSGNNEAVWTRIVAAAAANADRWRDDAPPKAVERFGA